jgi:imidazolonepropionase-like amidohydrolase
VDALQHAGVDCVKAVLEAGNETWGKFNRLDPQIYRAVIGEASRLGLPTATHTGSAEDVKLAVETGSNSIEHGSSVDLIPEESFAAMKERGIFYDPTLSVFEAYSALGRGNTQLLDRPLLQQVGPGDLINNTKAVYSEHSKSSDPARLDALFEIPKQNLLRAFQNGVTLITGSDAGNPMVIHGPTVQHELELWVSAKVPSAVALQAATYNAAKALHQENRIGLIHEGMDATFLLLDGDPVQDISATEHINAVFLRGEQIDRGDLFNQFKK